MPAYTYHAHYDTDPPEDVITGTVVAANEDAAVAEVRAGEYLDEAMWDVWVTVPERLDSAQ